MILWFSPQILEDALFPVTFHMIPIINEAMSYRVMETIGLGVGDSFITDEEVKILYTPF